MDKRNFNKPLKDFIKEVKEGKSPETKTAKDKEYLSFAKLVVESEKFVKEFIEKNGTKAFISERLRAGYIGEIVHCDNGASYIQSVRGRPFGTIVAIKAGDSISIGTSFVSDEDKNKGHPVVGLALALRRAVERRDNNIFLLDKKIKSKARKQAEHFEKRAKAYFHPDVFSHSRGSEPVVYEDYDEIHERRKMILGE